MKPFKYIPLLLILIACRHSTKKTIVTDTSKTVLTKIIKRVAIDSTLMTEPGAVIIQPSARLVDKIQKENPKDGDYDTILDDDVWYMSQSEHYLDSLKVRKIHRESEGSMRFKTSSGKTYVMKIDTLFFGIILFNGKDKPIQADIVEIKYDFEKYMKH
jgi:hypothetical protein